MYIQTNKHQLDSYQFYVVATQLIDDIPLVIEELWQAFREKDDDTLVLMSNILKGLASNFQIRPLMHLAGKLESNCGELTESRKEELIETIAIESQRTIDVLRHELSIA